MTPAKAEDRSRHRLPDNEAVREALGRAARTVIELGRSLLGRPIWCAEGGGIKGPAILVTAGAHADETSWVHRRRALAREPSKPTISSTLSPTATRFSLEGFASALRAVCAATEAPRSLEDVRMLLRRHGEILVEDGSYMLAMVGELAFATVRPTMDSFGSEKLIKMLSHSLRTKAGLGDHLAFKRILVPANAPKTDGRGTDERAYTAFVAEDGFIGSYNRFFGHPQAPPEVRVVQDFVDHVCPGLAIDLHEGWDDGFFWFIPPRGAVDTRLADAIEDNVIAALHDATIATSSLHELVPSMPRSTWTDSWRGRTEGSSGAGLPSEHRHGALRSCPTVSVTASHTRLRSDAGWRSTTASARRPSPPRRRFGRSNARRPNARLRLRRLLR